MVDGLLSDKIDYAVLEIIMSTNGTHQDSWGRWMTLANDRVPDLESQDDLLASFKRLRGSHIVILTKPDNTTRDAFEYSGNQSDDDSFFFQGPFNATITPTGRRHWEHVRLVDAKQAVVTATKYLNALMGDSISKVMLEEVWLSVDEKFWNVTLSAQVPIPKDDAVPKNPFQIALTGVQDSHRVYKTLKIDVATGMVKSMTIKQP